MNSKTIPYWYKLINHLKANGAITTGLTIPFIFGAYEALGCRFTTITQLIEHIYNSKTDKYPVIQKCPVIGQHVVMTEKKEICNKSYKKDIRFENPNGNILFISTNTDLGKTLQKVCSNLTSNYVYPIERFEYSWNNMENNWKTFELDEIEMIKSIT